LRPVGAGAWDSTRDAKSKYAGHRRIERAAIARGIRRNVDGLCGQVGQIQPQAAGITALNRRCQKVRGSPRVRSNTVFLPFANLDTCGGKLDQRPEQIGRRAPAAARMPELFPDLVRFPIIAGIEQIDAALEPTREPIARAGRWCRDSRAATEQTGRWRTGRMWPGSARHIRIRWETCR